MSPTDLQLSLKEGRGLDRRSGKGDLANKGGGRGRSKDREVKLSNLGKEIVEVNKCQELNQSTRNRKERQKKKKAAMEF